MFKSWADNLLEKYPTTLTAGDDAPDRARPWTFTPDDIFLLKAFHLKVGDQLLFEVGNADLGIGHCRDGAVWAVVKPKVTSEATLRGSASPGGQERIVSIWLRFHPGKLNDLFPPDNVQSHGDAKLIHEMKAVAGTKLFGSWHAGNNVMIPYPNSLTVDVDVSGSSDPLESQNPKTVRRFFVVERAEGSVKYISAFENRPVSSPAVLKPGQAQACFDGIWEAFDRHYPMFVLRPEVDWNQLRAKFRPKALASISALELGGTCAAMLSELRDLHVWVTVGTTSIPVFNRLRTNNANPVATRRLIRDLKKEGGSVEWGLTAEQVGYLAIYQWSDESIPRLVDQVLEEMKESRGLILDVRLNGGGSEPLAREVAGRFLGKEFVYGFSRYRKGPGREDLGEKQPRTVSPCGPWRYDRPVVLLIGQKCMSSNESFIAMMSGDDQVVTMGDHTCGSSGNPKMLHFDPDITVSLPQWIDYLPDGTPLDEKGFVPKVVFVPQPGAFEGQRDDLLQAALERIRTLL